MNTDTNDLYDLNQLQPEEIRKLLQTANVFKVPDELQKSAERHLKGEKYVKVPVTSRSSLAKWAAQVRKNQQKSKQQ
jgi:hypothetical protein